MTNIHKSLFALALGTFALGMAEFSMMGIMPFVAAGLDVSLTEAGNYITAYALGVCAGACFMVFACGFSLKKLLIFLALIIAAGNGMAALAPNDLMFLLTRFISGLPHGAYFGVASIVADRIAPPDRKALAVALMVSGMTVANLFGVPLSTWLSLNVNWRWCFVLVSFVGVVLVGTLWRWIPEVPGLPRKGLKAQFQFLKKPAPWLLLAATTLGNGAIFCWFSYVTPLLLQVSGFAETSLSALMLLAGAGMVAGNLIGGRLSDRYTPGRIVAAFQLLTALTLLLIFFFSPLAWLSAVLMTVCTACLFGLSSPQQLLLIRYSPGGQLLGAASVQMAFNLGNALGAALGGQLLSHSLGFQVTALAGVPLALVAFGCVVLFCRRYEEPTVQYF